MEHNQLQRVRNACEACHARKQRCCVPEPGGPCQACKDSSRHCFFVPRLKAGRPRRGRISADREIKALARTIPACVQNPLVAPGPPMQCPGSGPGCDAAEPSPYLIDQGLSPFQPQDYDVSISRQVSSHPDDLDRFDDYFDTSAFQQDPGFSSSSSSTVQSTTPDSIPTPACPNDLLVDHQQMDMVSTADPLSLLLQRFTELHQLSSLLSRHMQITPSALDFYNHCRAVMSALDAVCTHMLAITNSCAAVEQVSSVPIQGSPDPVDTAVLLGLALKVLGVCEAMIAAGEQQLAAAGVVHSPTVFQSAVVHGTLKQHNQIHRPHLRRADSGYEVVSDGVSCNTETEMAVILMLKQIDLHLTQTRVCLSRITRRRDLWDSDAVDERTSALHRRIRLLVDITYH